MWTIIFINPLKIGHIQKRAGKKGLTEPFLFFIMPKCVEYNKTLMETVIYVKRLSESGRV